MTPIRQAARTLVLFAMCAFWAGSAHADSASKLEASARAALKQLDASSTKAAALRKNAVAVLVFPEIYKGGFLIAGQHGHGVLFKGDTVAGYYDSTAASFGLQAGVQKFGYALIFMSNKDLSYLNSSSGWEVGTAPSLTVVDKGIAGSLSTTTVKDGIYAFFFAQQGLMGGLGLQGAKITKVSRGSLG